MYKLFTGLHKSPSDKRDFLVTTFVQDMLEIELPEAIDYSNRMTPVKHQGHEGACAGFAGVAVKEYQEKMDYSLPDDEYIDLSERFLYEEGKKISGHREGTTLKAIAKVLVEKGVCEEKFWKYIPGQKEQPHAGAYFNAKRFRVHPYYTRITNDKELKGALIKFGAIVIGVKVYRNWYRQKNGHIPNPTFCDRIKGSLGGHAICLVGYNDKTQEYKFKNSWGTEWGDEGYGYISYKHMNDALLDAVCFVDIDDPNEYQNVPIKTMADIPFLKRLFLWT